MKQKTILGLTTFLLIVVLTGSAYASWTLSEGIDGYIYRCGIPEEGIIVRVYDASNNLVGYGVNDDNSQGMLGTDITDINGYFHIAWLEGEYADYTVVAETPSGYLIGAVTVTDLACGETRRICGNYCPPCNPGLTPGFWKNNLAVYLGLAKGNRGYSDPTGSPTVTKDTMGDFFDSLAGTYDLNQLYRELCPQLDGTTADIRNAAANIFNVAAGLSPGPPWV